MNRKNNNTNAPAARRGAFHFLANVKYIFLMYFSKKGLDIYIIMMYNKYIKSKEDNTMKGTEKQIKWAEDIKRETLETCDANIRLSQARLDEYKVDMYKLDEIAYRLVKAAFVKMFAGIDDAAVIIKRRHRMGGSGANSLADQIRSDLGKGKSADEIAAMLHVTTY